jgi:ribonuclease HII
LSDPSIDLWLHERLAREAGYLIIAGVDEVGRGPLAGPVVAACVLLPEGFDLSGINDSKKLTEKQRERAEIRIRAEALAIGLGIVSPETIDRINILQATREAMRIAFRQLSVLPYSIRPDYVLIDGLPVPDFPCLVQKSVISGDSQSVSIAAASIVAKVARDQMMRDYAVLYPEYGFAGHKGYGAATHLAALREFGPCPIHRRSFAPVAASCRTP